MRSLLRLGVASVVAMVFVAAPVGATIIADSGADWQNQTNPCGNWSYGSYDVGWSGPYDQNPGPYTVISFTPFVIGQWKSSTASTGLPGWESANVCAVTKDAMSPVWTERPVVRWNSTVAGQVNVQGEIGTIFPNPDAPASGGDGFTFLIFVDGVEQFRHAFSSPDPSNYADNATYLTAIAPLSLDVPITVSVGSKVEFMTTVIGPSGSIDFNKGGYDQAEYRLKIDADPSLHPVDPPADPVIIADSSSDWQNDKNPNGDWTYGGYLLGWSGPYTENPGPYTVDDFVAFPDDQWKSSTTSIGLPGWETDNMCCVGQDSMNPPWIERPIVRWTSTVAGQINVVGEIGTWFSNSNFPQYGGDGFTFLIFVDGIEQFRHTFGPADPNYYPDDPSWLEALEPLQLNVPLTVSSGSKVDFMTCCIGPNGFSWSKGGMDQNRYTFRISYCPPTLPTVGASNRAVLDSITAVAAGSHKWVFWGKVNVVDADHIAIDDGSGAVIDVIAPGHGLSNDDYVRVRGTLDLTGTPTLTSTQAITKISL